MEYVTPFLVLLAAWGWPLTVLVLAYIFRKEIGALIDRIKHLKVLGNDVDASHRQTPETGQKLGEELDRLKKGRVEPTLGMRAHYSAPVPAPASSPQVPIRPTPPGTTALSPFQQWVAASIIHDPSLEGLDCEEKLKRVVNVQAIYQIELMFERTFRVIFGSQMDALRMAQRDGGIPLSEVEATFNNAKGLFPTIHEGRTFEQWGQFLINAGLAIETRVDGIRMAQTTEIGREFLAYIDERGYPRPVG